jgi:hypothetical protein
MCVWCDCILFPETVLGNVCHTGLCSWNCAPSQISQFLPLYSRNHKLSGHSGFEPCLCYGDILLSFLYMGQSGGPPSRPTLSPIKLVPSSPQLLLPRPELTQEMGKKQHDFIRTHFHRTTQCEFCGKKVMLTIASCTGWHVKHFYT